MSNLPEQTLVLCLSDRSGALEAIAATFAHRGISLSWVLANDGDSSPDGYATVIVHFQATPSHTGAIKRVLSRLSRVVSVTEPAASGRAVRLCALVRLIRDAPVPVLPEGSTGHVDFVTCDEVTQEAIYSLSGTPEEIGESLAHLQMAGHARAVMQTLLAL